MFTHTVSYIFASGTQARTCFGTKSSYCRRESRAKREMLTIEGVEINVCKKEILLGLALDVTCYGLLLFFVLSFIPSFPSFILRTSEHELLGSSTVILLRLSHSSPSLHSLLSPHLMLLLKFALNCMPWIFYHLLSSLPSSSDIACSLIPRIYSNFVPSQTSEREIRQSSCSATLIDLRCREREYIVEHCVGCWMRWSWDMRLYDRRISLSGERGRERMSQRKSDRD